MSEFCDDINFSEMSTDESDKRFNSIIGHIEDIIMNEKFLRLHNSFLEKYWREFDNGEENKLIYMDIFKRYNEVIEKYIEEELLKNMDHFDMAAFERELVNRQNDLEGEIFEILSTFTDFFAFKTMFLDYKAVKEGVTIDFSKDLLVTKYKINTTS